MKVTNWYYLIFAEDSSGYPSRHYHFFDEADACRFALANKNVIAYGIPSVYKITYTYNPDKLQHQFYRKMEEQLDVDTILSYETERK